MPTLKSPSYRVAIKSMKNQTFAIKRLNSLLIRIMTRINKINVYLGSDVLEDKELKSKISLLSSLLEVKKKIKSELKELESETKGSENLFG